MPTTIKDIAKRLNISVSTVSYALNGGPRSVPDEVRDRVLETARELEYRPNRLARSLVTRRSYIVGVVPLNATPNLVLSPFTQFALNGIVNEAESLHYDVLLCTRHDQTESQVMAGNLLNGWADGLIFVTPPEGSRLLDIVAGSGMSSVTISGTPRAGTPNYTVDNAGGVHQAVRHLYELGHRRIGQIAGPSDLADGRERRAAFEEAVRSLGLTSREGWTASGNFTTEEGRVAAERILASEDRPTALFCANDEMAIGALEIAKGRGIDVPRDLSLVGFDDAPLVRHLSPALTTVRQPIEGLGISAMRGLVRLIEGDPAAPTEPLPTDLIVRASTSRPQEDPS